MESFGYKPQEKAGVVVYLGCTRSIPQGVVWTKLEGLDYPQYCSQKDDQMVSKEKNKNTIVWELVWLFKLITKVELGRLVQSWF